MQSSIATRRPRRRKPIGKLAKIRRGSKRASVLIITNERDVGADFLVRELGQRGVPVVRCNTERAVEWALTTVPGKRWSIGDAMRQVESDECSGVWWRRPEAPEVSGLSTSEMQTLRDQWWAFLVALSAVSGPTWVSDPHALRAAEDKAHQLATAMEVGFRIPETLWSNSRGEAVDAVNRWGGQAVVKSVTSAWWESDDRGWFVFAQLIGVEDLPADSALRSAPVCFQQPIIPKRDIRVTVIGRRAIAAMRAPDLNLVGGDDPVDWRRAPEVTWEPCEIPETVARHCVALTERLGLRFSGIDLALDEAGNHWFLESNPNGEWGWLQRAGLPIAEALAEELTQ